MNTNLQEMTWWGQTNENKDVTMSNNLIESKNRLYETVKEV